MEQNLDEVIEFLVDTIKEEDRLWYPVRIDRSDSQVELDEAIQRYAAERADIARKVYRQITGMEYR